MPDLKDMEPGRQPLYRSFCGRRDDEVQKLVAGPTVFICDQCTRLVYEIMVKELGKDFGR